MVGCQSVSDYFWVVDFAGIWVICLDSSFLLGVGSDFILAPVQNLDFSRFSLFSFSGSVFLLVVESVDFFLEMVGFVD